jgi:hypothetical protein
MPTFAEKIDGEYQTIRCQYCDCIHWETKGNYKGIYGIWCIKCGRFGRWLGKQKAKPNNQKFIKEHRRAAEGLRVCCLCGINEGEAKLFGWDFHADHIKSEDFGGEDSIDNSWPLCGPCHYVKTSLEHRTRGIKKYLGGENRNDG